MPLASLENLVSTALLQTAEALVVCDERGCIVRASYAAKRLAGRAFTSEPFSEIFPLKLTDGHDFPFSSLLQGEILQGFEVTFSRKGDDVDLLVTGNPILGAEHEMMGCVVTLVDITGRKRFERELKRRSEVLEKSNAALEQFALAAARDLQEPLRMVTSFVQLLEKKYRGRLDSDADDYLDFASEGATRMYHFLHDLVAYCRVDEELPPSSFVESKACLCAARDALAISLDRERATVTYGELPAVLADELGLQQVFHCLMSNALNFRSDAAPRIHVDANRREKNWLFSVRDNGIGIDPTYSEKIFGIFQRLNHRKQYQGNGIGLALCKKIIEKHGGQIWVVSEPGEGATFYFTLPNP